MKKRVLDHDAMGVTDTCDRCTNPLEFAGYYQTLVGYISPKGHDHDDNCRSAVFGCRECKWDSRQVYKNVRNFCSAPECDWQGQESCNICQDTKPQTPTKIIEVEPPPPKLPWLERDCYSFITVEAYDELIKAAKSNPDAFKKVEKDEKAND